MNKKDLNEREVCFTPAILKAGGTGEDYLYPAHFFVAIELPREAARAFAPARSSLRTPR